MKHLRLPLTVIFLTSISLFAYVTPAHAACTNVPLSGNYTLSASCQFSFTNDGLDTTSGNNTAVLTIAASQTLTVGDGQTLIVGSLSLANSSVSVVFVGTGQIKPGTEYHIYTTDADSDLYPDNTSFTYATGTIRRAGMTSTYSDTFANSTAIDCGPSSALAKPGQTTPQTGTFVNVINASLTGDWNCNGTETKTYATATYSCTACTNGSGYASYKNTTSGFSGSVPNCGASGTYYTVTNAACMDPAVANCSTMYTTSTVAQTCL